MERAAIRDYIHRDALLRRFFDVVLFEDLPASDRRADEVYLEQVDRCGIYLGLFGDEYGPENTDGLSATEREFVRATAAGKTRVGIELARRLGGEIVSADSQQVWRGDANDAEDTSHFGTIALTAEPALAGQEPKGK